MGGMISDGRKESSQAGAEVKAGCPSMDSLRSTKVRTQ